MIVAGMGIAFMPDFSPILSGLQTRPIVEPEVLMDGPVAAHDIDVCYGATEWILKTVFQELYVAHVVLEGIVLKPNMVVPGKKSAKKAASA